MTQTIEGVLDELDPEGTMSALVEEGKEVNQEGSGEVPEYIVEEVRHEGVEEVPVREGHEAGMHAEVESGEDVPRCSRRW